MDYNALLDLTTEMGYRLAMSGAETFRVEESITRIMQAYGVEAEVFAIPNCMIVSIVTDTQQSMTRMRRIGYHGNDLDSVERFSNLSRKICAEKPDPKDALQWLKETKKSRIHYKLPMTLLGSFLGAAGYAVFFGGTIVDSLWAGLCGLIVGLATHFMNKLKVNPFFSTIVCSFCMAIAAYITKAMGVSQSIDSIIIGTLMILVPGLVFTNALRDIIFGDTNSGVNRIVQVVLIAAAIGLGTGAALNIATPMLQNAPIFSAISYPLWMQCIAAFVGCIGFAILFNIHGPGGLLCALGGLLAWFSYGILFIFTENVILSSFVGTIVASVYSEAMARIRKYPAISYLCVSLFPLLPGAGIYYTTYHLLSGNMEAFTSKGMETVGIAGALAGGILIISTSVRLWGVWKQHHKSTN